MWRILEISGDGYLFHVENQNLKVEKDGNFFPVSFSDIHSVICHGSNTLFSEEFFRKCLEFQIPVTFCSKKHIPYGMLLPYYQHCESYQRFSGQIATTLPRQKRAWQLIIKAKIKEEATNLEIFKSEESTVLNKIVKNVCSGDSSNQEAYAAKIYFTSLFGSGFIRRDEENGINGLLDYGYSIIRSCVARAVVACGLNPSLGVFHSANRNAFALVDDLMEPLRPIVERKVVYLIQKDKLELTPDVKRELISLSTEEVVFKKQHMELTTATINYVLEYFDFISFKSQQIHYPVLEKQWQ